MLQRIRKLMKATTSQLHDAHQSLYLGHRTLHLTSWCCWSWQQSVLVAGRRRGGFYGDLVDGKLAEAERHGEHRRRQSVDYIDDAFRTGDLARVFFLRKVEGLLKKPVGFWGVCGIGVFLSR